MNAIELLKKQHREVDALFKRFEKAKTDDQREAIFLEVASRLVAHDAIEREIFYPACERALGENEEVMEGIAEHGLIEFSVFRADKAKNKAPFEYLVKVLAEMVQHHVEEEEHEVLPKMEKKLSDAQLERLGSKMLERFELAMSKDFHSPLRDNLMQVLAGRSKTRAPKRTARTTAPRRAKSTRSRAGAGAQAKRSARGGRAARH
jgi:hypothetical protein